MRDPSLRTKGQNLTAAIAQPLDEELGWDTIQAKFQASRLLPEAWQATCWGAALKPFPRPAPDASRPVRLARAGSPEGRSSGGVGCRRSSGSRPVHAAHRRPEQLRSLPLADAGPLPFLREGSCRFPATERAAAGHGQGGRRGPAGLVGVRAHAPRPGRAPARPVRGDVRSVRSGRLLRALEPRERRNMGPGPHRGARFGYGAQGCDRAGGPAVGDWPADGLPVRDDRGDTGAGAW